MKMIENNGTRPDYPDDTYFYVQYRDGFTLVSQFQLELYWELSDVASGDNNNDIVLYRLATPEEIEKVEKLIYFS